MPGAVINRAWDLLDELENGAKQTGSSTGYQLQMPFGEPESHSEAVDELRELDIANMTPLEAMNALFKLQEQVNRTSE
jgi:DNA mismatch repair ATPase MutS